ncbi:hypothetical protein FB451DRAFT_1521084 [Mycena latifolia]|nr:hypothetical protein FB451DRAFT_1521084 [Mycena latifolia]
MDTAPHAPLAIAMLGKRTHVSRGRKEGRKELPARSLEGTPGPEGKEMHIEFTYWVVGCWSRTISVKDASIVPTMALPNGHSIAEDSTAGAGALEGLWSIGGVGGDAPIIPAWATQPPPVIDTVRSIASRVKPQHCDESTDTRIRKNIDAQPPRTPIHPFRVGLPPPEPKPAPLPKMRKEEGGSWEERKKKARTIKAGSSNTGARRTAGREDGRAWMHEGARKRWARLRR